MKDDGGSIFAGLKTSVPMGGNIEQVTRMEPEGGLSIRDWFAGMALQGMLSDSNFNEPPDAASKLCYRVADAMLTARKDNQ